MAAETHKRFGDNPHSSRGNKGRGAAHTEGHIAGGARENSPQETRGGKGRISIRSNYSENPRAQGGNSPSRKNVSSHAAGRQNGEEKGNERAKDVKQGDVSVVLCPNRRVKEKPAGEGRLVSRGHHLKFGD